MTPGEALAGLWQRAGLPASSLSQAELTGRDPVLPSSFAVGTAAQASLAAAALAASEVGQARGAAPQRIGVDMRHAAYECLTWFSLDGIVPPQWDPFSGLYRCSDGWVRVHANFAHHREGALRLLGLSPGMAERADAERALASWRALDFEQAAAEAGLVVAALRSFEEWDATAAGQAIAAQPVFTIERIGDAPPRALPPLRDDQRPLTGVRVLDLTRILAGPVGGRALAAYGADVMLVNSPNLPNIDAIAVTSRGKLSTHADLRTPAGQAALRALLADAHVFVQGYRPGGLAGLGWDPAAVAAQRPGIVCVSLSAYGTHGPWGTRRGYDSLVQTTTGFNHAEGQAAGGDAPRALPMQILDIGSGYLMALGASAALARQQREGGSWHVQVSLAQTAHWLRGLGRVADGFAAAKPELQPFLESEDSGFGRLVALRHAARFSRTPAAWTRPSMPPGSHPPTWPAG